MRFVVGRIPGAKGGATCQAKLSANETQQAGEIWRFDIRLCVEIVKVRIGTIHPNGGITKPLCADGVPWSESGEGYLFSLQAKGIRPHLIGDPAGFECADAVGAEVRFEVASEIGSFEVCLQHGFREVSQEGHSNATVTKLCECCRYIRPDWQRAVRLHQGVALRGGKWQLHCFGG